MKFFNQIARYILEERPIQKLAGIAIQGLEEGINIPALIVIAGMRDDQSPFLHDEYFFRLLKELDVSFLLDKAQSAAFLIKSTALEIIHHNVDICEGCNEIFNNLLIHIDEKYLAGKYAYDDIGLSKVYSAYITMEELASATEPWNTDKSNSQLINEAEIIIKAELVNWLIKDDNHISKTSA